MRSRYLSSTARVASVAMLALLASVTSRASAQQPVSQLTVDGRSAANPSIAADGEFVAVAFSAATVSAMDIFVATSADGGRTFGSPTQVNRVNGDARVSGEEPPRVALVPRRGQPPEIIVVWTARTGANWRLLSARSVDGGRTFGASSHVPGSEGLGTRGWQSVAVDGAGRVNVLWLDHRDLVAADSTKRTAGVSTPMPSHAHGASAAASTAPPNAAKPDPTERAALSQLLFSSLDGSAAVPITRSVCYCCKTSMVAAGNALYAVWRHVYADSHRDIAFASSADGGRTFSAPIRVSNDDWKIDGCPDNGPAIGVDARRRVHVLWPTLSDRSGESRMSLFYAVSSDRRRFSARMLVPTGGAASHPQLLIGADASGTLAWDEVVNGARRLGFARVRLSAGGVPQFTAIAAPDTRDGQWYPVIAPVRGGTVSAWVRQLEKGTAVAVARLRDPSGP